jgi:uncharacterized membrane protein YhiD involved in acid resistance
VLTLLDSILESFTTTASPVSAPYLLACTLASLAMGFGVALTYMYKNTYSKSFAVTLVLLPAMVQLVIMVVNGNLGAGVAVMGAFSLVRFRSIPGSAREISSIFFAMAVGLAAGMGYLMVSFIFLLMIGFVTMLLNTFHFGETKRMEKELKITIPENLNYIGMFDDLFEQYTKEATLMRVKTTNMGSLYELQYKITLKNPEIEKAFIDDLRCRNGNLNIVCGWPAQRRDEL